MRVIPTILLTLLAAFVTTLAVFLAVDGNLARITGWYRFRAGMPIFSGESASKLGRVTWMRISDLYDKIECERDERGVWWISTPFKDRMDPSAAQAILDFTANARMVSSIPMNEETRSNMREYGVETMPHTITLKTPQGEKLTTVARYTLGSTSPWLAELGDGETLTSTTYLRTNFYGRDKRIHVVSGNILHIFKNGLEALRDPRPLLFAPEDISSVSILSVGKEVKLNRISNESWSILQPVITAADASKVDTLLRGLVNLSAIRVEERSDVELPETPQTRIRLTAQNGGQNVELSLYPAFRKDEGDQMLCYATVSNRDVVFTLQADRRVRRKGSYATIVNAVCNLPVLPEKAMAQVRMSSATTYTNELPLGLSQLRSLQFSDIDTADVARISLRSTGENSNSIRLLLIPGEKDSQVGDTWLYATQDSAFDKAENAYVLRFLQGMNSIPALDIVADTAPGESMDELKRKYGLHEPRYMIFVLPRPCVVRAALFGHDLPLVKDRSPRIFLIRRYPDPESGRMAWFGMEEGSNSICQLSTKFTRLLSLRPEKWKNRQVMTFPISSVRKLTLGFQQAPLELDYDYIGESWTGTLGGEDVTPRINPHRATHYIRELQKMKVEQWLEHTDADAIRALRHPVFSVRVELEITDYSDAEVSVMEQQSEADEMQGQIPEEMLTETDDIDMQLRDLALAERKTHKETRTIEIAPSTHNSNEPFFYGRITETGEMFIIPFAVAQGLAGNIIDM